MAAPKVRFTMAADFDGDAFISYAHLDNVALAGRHGWVASLQRALEVRVAAILGTRPRIWWDPHLRGNDVFPETLSAQLEHVRALISVVSPPYIRSDWTLRELMEFCQAAERRGGVQVGDKSRLFKVLKRPVALEQQPPQLRPLLGYEFFKIDPESGRVRELDEIFGPEAQREFWIKLDDLAHDICALLELLHAQKTDAETGVGAIFLAVTTSDLRPEHDAVRRALQQQGHTVLPARALPLSADEVVAAVREDLARCRMSVHMFGRNSSLVPEGGTRSLLEMQHELAIERASRGPFAHRVWIPRGLEVHDERQRRVIDQLRMDPRLRGDSDLLETSLEELQTELHETLKTMRGSTRGSTADARQKTLREVGGHLYLVYDQRDAGNVGPWADALFAHFEVVHPSFEGDEAEIREFHEENLRSCDGVLIVYGAANEVWLRRKLAEIQKSAAYGRETPMPEVAICVIPPDTPEKARFRTHLAPLIAQTGGFSVDALQPFIEALKSRTRGSRGADVR